MVSVIVPTLCVGMHPVTLCVTILRADAERPERHSHAERGNDLNSLLHSELPPAYDRPG